MKNPCPTFYSLCPTFWPKTSDKMSDTLLGIPRGPKVWVCQNVPNFGKDMNIFYHRTQCLYIKKKNVQHKMKMSDTKLKSIGHNVRGFKKFFIYTGSLRPPLNKKLFPVHREWA